MNSVRDIQAALPKQCGEQKVDFGINHEEGARVSVRPHHDVRLKTGPAQAFPLSLVPLFTVGAHCYEITPRLFSRDN